MRIKRLTNVKSYQIDKIIKREFPHMRDKEVKFHIKKGVSHYAHNENELVAFSLALNYEKHSSLTLFYISPKYRHSKKAFFFFSNVTTKLRKPIYVRSDDVSKYRSITRIYKDDIYQIDLSKKEQSSKRYL